MLRFGKIFSRCLVLFFASSQTLAQVQPPQDMEASCRKFVQQFYDWYLPRAKDEHSGRAGDIVLKYRSSSFSLELRKRLKEDSDAQAKSEDIVGLDFDPFLNTEDSGFKRCTAGKVIRKTESYWAEVSCVFPGPNPDKSQIMPELIFQQGRWLFVNFHYHFDSGDDNLLNILKKLRKDRQEPRDHR